VPDRSFERDIIPMARAEGFALAPWAVLGAGKIRSDAEGARRRKTGEKGRTMFNPNWERTEERKMCLVLEQIAKEVAVESITSGALSLLRLKMKVSGAEQLLNSWGCVRPAQGPICFPYYRRTEG
jgi:aryl-alcohol dehydrogenase-like predicted oxidoreductase